MTEEPNLKQDTLRALEWERVLEALARHARSSMGAQYCRALKLEDDLAQATDRQRETAEKSAYGTSTGSQFLRSFCVATQQIRGILAQFHQSNLWHRHRMTTML